MNADFATNTWDAPSVQHDMADKTLRNGSVGEFRPFLIVKCGMLTSDDKRDQSFECHQKLKNFDILDNFARDKRASLGRKRDNDPVRHTKRR
jgi:hypothetical protein